jgi:zinc protease
MRPLTARFAFLPLLAALATPAPALDFPKYEKVTKGNTTVLLMKQDRVPLVSIRVTLELSTRENKNIDQARAALYLYSIKHGTKKYPGEQWLKTLEATGAELIEEVGPQTISLAAEARKEDVEKILDLFLDGLTAPELKQEKVEQERGRLVAELESMGDQPQQIASRAADLAYFGKSHPYGRSSIGSPLKLKNINVNDILGAHFSTARNCSKVIVTFVGDDVKNYESIVAAGKVLNQNAGSPSSAENECIIPGVNITNSGYGPLGVGENCPGGLDCQYLLKAKGGEVDTQGKMIKNGINFPRRVIIVNLPESQQTQVRLMMAGPTDIYSPLRLAAIPLGGSFTSRLVDELRVKRGLTYGASSRMNQRKLASVFTISSFTKVPSTEEFLKVLFEELNKAKKPGLTTEEIARGKALYKGEAPQRWERYSGLAAILEEVELRGLPADYPLESINHVEKNTQAEAQAALNAALDLDHYVLVLAGPAAKLKPIAAKYGVVEVWEKKQVIEP